MATYVFKNKTGKVKFTYLNPAPEALDQMVLRWWKGSMQESPDVTMIEGQRYGMQFRSSIAAAYESQAWVLNQKPSLLAKACFFRRFALSLRERSNPTF